MTNETGQAEAHISELAAGRVGSLALRATAGSLRGELIYDDTANGSGYLVAMADESMLVAVLQTLPRPGRIKVTDPKRDWWQPIGVPVWADGWPDTAQALEQLRAAGYVPDGAGVAGWRTHRSGYAIEVRFVLPAE